MLEDIAPRPNNHNNSMGVTTIIHPSQPTLAISNLQLLGLDMGTSSPSSPPMATNSHPSRDIPTPQHNMGIDLQCRR